jgi:hypothetical protein
MLLLLLHALKIETESWCYQSINQNLCEYLGILSKSFNAKKKMLKKNIFCRSKQNEECQNVRIIAAFVTFSKQEK